MTLIIRGSGLTTTGFSKPANEAGKVEGVGKTLKYSLQSTPSTSRYYLNIPGNDITSKYYRYDLVYGSGFANNDIIQQARYVLDPGTTQQVFWLNPGTMNHHTIEVLGTYYTSDGTLTNMYSATTVVIGRTDPNTGNEVLISSNTLHSYSNNANLDAGNFVISVPNRSITMSARTSAAAGSKTIWTFIMKVTSY